MSLLGQILITEVRNCLSFGPHTDFNGQELLLTSHILTVDVKNCPHGHILTAYVRN